MDDLNKQYIGLKIRHQCQKCGTLHQSIPVEAQTQTDQEGRFAGLFFMCYGKLQNGEVCKSSMFIRKDRL